MIKAILFDFDGVMVDTFDFCYQIHRQTNPDLSVEACKDWFNGNIYDTIDHNGIPKGSKVIDFWPHYVVGLNSKTPDPELVGIIKQLGQNYKLFIVSSSRDEFVKNFLTKFDLIQYFQQILGSDTDKSKEKKIHNIFEKYNLLPAECVFITDTTGDIVEAKNCGVESVAVSWGYHDEQKLVTAKPLQVVNSPAELYEAIIKI
jgi:phosphoglycolate phosphatase